MIRLGFCVVVFGWGLFSYLNTQTELASLKVQLPELEKRLGTLQEENRRMLCEIEGFENPTRLIELVHRPEFGYLKHPLLREILTVPQPMLSCE